MFLLAPLIAHVAYCLHEQALALLIFGLLCLPVGWLHGAGIIAITLARGWGWWA